ncbi:MAG: peptidoglycan-binding protein [Acidobacteriaceae bacterium]|nr:peptidoglycan-binding protein [Acidobacteriaceae bacterium]
MRWPISISLFTAMAMAAPTNPPAKKVTTAAGSKAAVHRTSYSTTKASSTSRTRRRVARTRTPPPPSYQLHPDPERYQQIQQALTDRGYFKGEVNGQWSDDSVDALKRFQADQKLTDDGKINALTLTGLGLGPKHDGTTAAAVPPPVADPQPPAPEPPPHAPESPGNVTQH